jgi:hypothetical protein
LARAELHPNLFRVLLFVSEMAAILFHDEKVLAEMTGGRALTTEERVRAEYEPRKVLERILQERGLDPRAGIRTAVEHLDPKAVSDFPVVKELGEFLRGAVLAGGLRR